MVVHQMYDGLDGTRSQVMFGIVASFLKGGKMSKYFLKLLCMACLILL